MPVDPKFQFAAALSTHGNTAQAIEEVCAEILKSLTAAPQLVLAFFSLEHLGNADRIASELADRLGTAQVFGCSGEAIAGTGREVEQEPALSVWAAVLPGVEVLPMHLRFERTPEGSGISGWPAALPEKFSSEAGMLVLGDPYSFPAEVLLELLDAEHPGIPVFGGMASTASQPGENRLLFQSQVVTEGAVAVLLQGPLRIRTVVSQGCRPIGKPFVITRAERNVIHQLGGAPAYQRLVEVFQTLATREQDQVRKGLHVGRVVSEYQEHFEQGDFLVRNVIGMDANEGAIAIGDYVRTGQTVQFHVRDWETADGELKQLLAPLRPADRDVPRGALLFTCNGRGTRLFPEPHHDAGAIAKQWGDVPLAGFFAAGELGPVGKRNFVHGFTASIVLLEPSQSSASSPIRIVDGL